MPPLRPPWGDTHPTAHSSAAGASAGRALLPPQICQGGTGDLGQVPSGLCLPPHCRARARTGRVRPLLPCLVHAVRVTGVINSPTKRFTRPGWPLGRAETQWPPHPPPLQGSPGADRHRLHGAEKALGHGHPTFSSWIHISA